MKPSHRLVATVAAVAGAGAVALWILRPTRPPKLWEDARRAQRERLEREAERARAWEARRRDGGGHPTPGYMPPPAVFPEGPIRPAYPDPGLRGTRGYRDAGTVEDAELIEDAELSDLSDAELGELAAELDASPR